MSTFRITYVTPVTVTVEVSAEDYDAAESFASEAGHALVQEYLSTLGTRVGDERIVAVHADLDGVGFDAIEERE